MSATLKLTHKAIGAEVRRGAYDVVVDGERVGSVEMNDTIEIPVEPGRHTLQVRNGRNSSSTQTFDAAQGEIVAFRCTGKRFLPIFRLPCGHAAAAAAQARPLSVGVRLGGHRSSAGGPHGASMEAFPRRSFIGGLALVGAAAAVPATAERAQAASAAACAPEVETWQLIGKDVFTGGNWSGPFGWAVTVRS
jgi:hypothetical protein